MKIVFIGSTISSYRGNVQSSIYRALLTQLGKIGHSVYFLEYETKANKQYREFSKADYYSLYFFKSLPELKLKNTVLIETADLVIIGSKTPEGSRIIDWVMKTALGLKCFYDLEASKTLGFLENGNNTFIRADQVVKFDLILSTSGGRMLRAFQEKYKARYVCPLYGSVDQELYYPQVKTKEGSLGYIGPFSEDREPSLKEHMFDVAVRLKDHQFGITGIGYTGGNNWPRNIQYIDYLAPDGHRNFYSGYKYALHVTRRNLVTSGYSPGIRLFEAAACGVPIISDYWEGMEEFFEPGKEILLSESTGDTINIILTTPDEVLKEITDRALKKVTQQHSSSRRAIELLSYYLEVKNRKG